MKKLLLLGLSTFAISAHAWEPSYYAGAGFSPWKVNMQSVPVDFSIQTIDAFAGIELFPHISLEARVGAGINEGRDTYYFWDDLIDETTGMPVLDTDTGEPVQVLYGAPLTTELNYFASVYFRPFISNDRASLYGLLGVTTVDMDTNFDGLTAEDYSDSAASFGVGVSFSMSRHIDVTAEWKKLINSDEYDIRGGTIGFAYKF